MPAGQLYINGDDAYTTYGVSLADGAKAVLMQPVALKERVTNSSRLEHGKRYINLGLKKESREITLEMHMVSSSWSDYLTKYAAWNALLMGGTLNISTSWQSGVVYKCLYLSCSQFAEYGGLAKFALRLVEPNPNDRSAS